MSKLLNLEGAKELSKKEQQAINGGLKYCGDGKPCPPGWSCVPNVPGGRPIICVEIAPEMPA